MNEVGQLELRSATFSAMLAQEEGGIILNVASAAGLNGAPKLAAYAAAKHAVVGLSYKNLARLLEAQGTHVGVQVLINRVNQGKFSFAFALEVLAALGVERLEIARPPAKMARAKPGPR